MTLLHFYFIAFVAPSIANEVKTENNNVTFVLKIHTGKEDVARILTAFHLAADPINKTLYQNHKLVCKCNQGCHSEFLDSKKIPNVCVTNGTCTKIFKPGGVVYSCEDLPRVDFRCRNKNVDNTACCNNFSFCNIDLDRKSAGRPSHRPATSWWPVFGAIFFVIVAVFVFFVSILRRHRGQKCSIWIFKHLFQEEKSHIVEQEKLIRRNFFSKASRLLDRFAMPLSEENKSSETIGSNDESGSGSGMPALMQRTVARQVELLEPIGTGRFGEVWRGTWRSETVAVKIFDARDEQSWKREVEIYETTWLRHPNILAYIASDTRDVGTVLQLWLITEYQEYGSLYDYLIARTVSPAQAAKMIRSIASGLSFLHFELENSSHTNKKPAIAHRDIKSRNILVKSDLSCVIADFGLAVKFENGTVDLPDNAKCGTIRYLSPEMLSDDYNVKNFESHKMSDVYAMGIVIWELLRRCEVDGHVESYEVPFYEYVRREPTLEEMKECVFIKKQRPGFCSYWHDYYFTSEVYRLMCECWADCPSNRHTASSVRITFDRMITYYSW